MRLPRVLAAASLAALVVAGCRGTLQLTPDDSARVLARPGLDAPDPGQAGPLAVRYLTYGSGTDRRRAAYRDSVAFRTKAVGAGKPVDLGGTAKSRRCRIRRFRPWCRCS